MKATPLSLKEYNQLRAEIEKQDKRQNKYNAEICEHGGRKYDSKGERNYAIELEWRKKAGEIKHITPQFPIKIVVGGVLICRYVIDFKIELKNGKNEFHEFKGCETEVWKLKWKLVKALYPHWEFKLIKL